MADFTGDVKDTNRFSRDLGRVIAAQRLLSDAESIADTSEQLNGLTALAAQAEGGGAQDGIQVAAKAVASHDDNQLAGAWTYLANVRANLEAITAPPPEAYQKSLFEWLATGTGIAIAVGGAVEVVGTAAAVVTDAVGITKDQTKTIEAASMTGRDDANVATGKTIGNAITQYGGLALKLVLAYAAYRLLKG